MAEPLKPKIVRLKSGSRYQRLISRDSGTCNIKAGHVILKKGEEIGKHSTDDLEEALVILKGKGRLEIGNAEALDFKDNTVLYVPPDTVHNIRNTGAKILKYIFITSNAR